jgi:class 3 adenylate cyclase
VWVFTALVWSSYVYIQELEKKTQFVNGYRRVRQYLKMKSILNILVPSIVRDKLRGSKKNYSEEEGEATIIYLDIQDFDFIIQQFKGKKIDLLNFLDGIYNNIDQLCEQFGLQKIETVGKTYLACGGLKSAERKIDTRFLNRHHSVRVADFAIEITNFIKTVNVMGMPIQMNIGVHTGPIISGIMGETKPQFALYGETLNKCIKICEATKNN